MNFKQAERNISTLDAVASIDSIVGERHKLLDLANPRHVMALEAARARLGSAFDAARDYGVAGFVLQYHSQTRLAESYVRGATR